MDSIDTIISGAIELVRRLHGIPIGSNFDFRTATQPIRDEVFKAMLIVALDEVSGHLDEIGSELVDMQKTIEDPEFMLNIKQF